MIITHAQKEEIARRVIADYQTRRIEAYRKMRLKNLLGKDVLLFAARNITTANGFLDEAFKAAESSSEETVMGSTRQALAVLLSNGADSGDITVVRDGIKYYCEMKTQANTTNSGSFAAVLQELKYAVENDRSYAHRTVTNQGVDAAILISRSEKTIDEVRVFHCDSDAKKSYPMLDGFEYRYISGRAMWQWVGDVDAPSRVATSAAVRRESVIASHHTDAVCVLQLTLRAA